MDNVNEIIAQQALNQIDEAVLKLNTATKAVIELADAAKNITFNITGVDLLGFAENSRNAQKVIGEISTALVELKQSTIDVKNATTALDVNMGTALQHYANMKLQIYENNGLMAQYSKAIDDASVALKNMGSMSAAVRAQVEAGYNQTITNSTAKIKELIVSNKQLADEIVKNNKVISGSVAERAEKEAIAEQKAAIVNKNRIDAQNAREADLYLKQQMHGEAYIALLESQSNMEQASAIKNKISIDRKNAAAADLLLKQNAYGEAYIALLEREAIVEQIAAIKNKNVIDARNAREQRRFDVAWEQGERWQKAQVANAEKVSKGFSIMGVKLDGIFIRMAVRMALMGLIFAPIIAGLTALWEWFRKDAKAAEEFSDKLKQISEKNMDNIAKEESASKSLIKTAANVNLSLKTRVDAIDELRKANEGLFDDYGNEIFLSGKTADAEIRLNKAIEARYKSKAYAEQAEEANKMAFKKTGVTIDEKGNRKQGDLTQSILNYNAALKDTSTDSKGKKYYDEAQQSEIAYRKKIMDKQLEEYDRYRKAVEYFNQSQQEEEEKLQNLKSKNQQLNIDKLKAELSLIDEKIQHADLSKYGLTDKSTKEDVIKIKKDRDGDLANLISEEQRLKDLIAELEGKKDAKGPKSHEARDNKKEMEAELKAVEELDTKRKNAAQQEFDLSHKSFTDHVKQLNKEEEITTDSYSKRIKIVEKYRGRVGETDQQYQNRLSVAYNNEQDIIIKANEQIKKIDDEIHKRHLQADEDSIKYVDDLKKQRAEIEKLTSELRNLQQSNAIELKGAGFHLFGDDAADFNKQRDLLKLRIEAATEEVGKAKEGAANEGLRTDKSPDLETILKFNQQEIEAQKTQEQAKHELDMLYAERKKQALEKIKDLTIDLAKETMQAVITIQDNQFARESQQLQIQQQKLEIQNQQKVEAINATTNYQITKDNQLSIQAAQHAAKQNELQHQQNDIALRKAKFDKEAAEAGILLNTLLAESKVLPLFADPLTVPYAIAQTAAITALGAVQYAAAASTPLPQFWTGGVTETPVFSAGEKGIELMTTPDGKSYFSEGTATAYSAPIGTTITSHDETMKMIKWATTGINGEPAPVNISVSNNDGMMKEFITMLSDKFDDLGYVIVKSKPVIPKNESVREVLREKVNTQIYNNR